MSGLYKIPVQNPRPPISLIVTGTAGRTAVQTFNAETETKCEIAKVRVDNGVGCFADTVELEPARLAFYRLADLFQNPRRGLLVLEESPMLGAIPCERSETHNASIRTQRM